MLGRGETIGVFQVESGGMRKALVEMRADRFEDIIALVALYRPGPMANIPTYCARKLGQEKPDYIHPKLEPILRETFGVIIYQEQVMQIAQILSGYSLGEADLLRRAMGKKIKAEMDAQRARFVNGAVERGLSQSKADEIFDLLAKFADYGFNKSHAAAYALIAYWTAWFKANHPVEFLAASMTLDKSNTDKLAEFRGEALRLGIKVAPPSVNGSNVDFDARLGEGGALSIAYALVGGQGRRRSAGRGAGRRARRPAVRLAERYGAPHRSARRQQEGAGEPGRRRRLRRDRARSRASPSPRSSRRWRSPIAPPRNGRRGRTRLFGESDSAPLKVRAAPWPAADRLRREFDAVGFFLSGHPLDAYQSVLAKLARRRAGPISRAPCGAARPRRASPPACSIARSGAPNRARSSASSSFPIRQANMRRSFSRKASANIATCSKKARTCW